METNKQIVDRIASALEAASKVALQFSVQSMTVDRKKERNDPVTEADRALNDLLRNMLPRGDEGWFSEETADDFKRLQARDVWIVDPLDGTREFVEGLPEWVISIGYVRDGVPIAGGMCNPQSGEVFIGSVETGLTYNGKPARVRATSDISGGLVLASRSEVKRGEWKPFENQPYTIKPLGSVAYKLGLVAAGLADATWTLVPKNEWDIAAGVALIRAGGGVTYAPDGSTPTFNNKNPLHPGLIAHSPALTDSVRAAIAGAVYDRPGRS
jgi:myo-inositol-1(or 4)-monophosphatase